MRKAKLYALVLTAAMTVGAAPVYTYGAEVNLEAADGTEAGEDMESGTGQTDGTEGSGDVNGTEETGSQGNSESNEGNESGGSTNTASNGNSEEGDGGSTAVSPDAETNADTAAQNTKEGSLTKSIGSAEELNTFLQGLNNLAEQEIVLQFSSVITVDNAMTIQVPAGKTLRITRDPEKKFAGNLFQVNSTLTLTAEAAKGDKKAGQLFVDGSLTDGKDMKSMIQVGKNGTLTVNSGVTLQNNHTDGNGGAISNEGTVNITGAVIQKNSAQAGAAVYSTGKLTVKGCTITGNISDKGAVYLSNPEDQTDKFSGAVQIQGNTKKDGTTACNVYLATGGTIFVDDKWDDGAKAGVTCEDATDGTPVYDTDSTKLATEELEGKIFYDTADKTIDYSGGILAGDEAEEEWKLNKLAGSCKWISENKYKVVMNTNQVPITYYVGETVVKEDVVDENGNLIDSKVPEVQEEGTVAEKNRFSFEISVKDNSKVNVFRFKAFKALNGNESKELEFAVEIPAYKAEVNDTWNAWEHQDENAITGLKESYKKGARMSFTAVGAGLDNEDPKAGDTAYVPVDAKVTGNDKTYGVKNFERDEDGNYTGSANLNNIAVGDYTLTVYYELREWEDGINDWEDAKVATSENEIYDEVTVSKEFKVTSSTTSNKKNAAAAKKSTGSSTSKSKNAKTADESPILPLAGLCAASVLAGGLVITRKRKLDK